MMQYPNIARRHSSQQGFTLVVIAALFVAFSIIAAVAVERNTTVQMITRRDATVEQLTRLSNAIIEYSVFHKSGTTLLYPCPARFDQLTNDVSGEFGKAIAPVTAGLSTCGGSGAAPVATGITVYGTSNALIQGMVPVLTLSQYGIGINDAFDPWNNRIIYVVNRNLTDGASPTATEQNNNATLTDIRTNYPTASPDFILISYGRDGVGGIKRTSTSVSIACGSGPPARFENCDADSTFNIGPSYTAATADKTTYFDDILTYYRQ